MPSQLTNEQYPANKLSNELVRLILDQIEPDPDRTIPIDRRQFLSVESFDFPPPPARGSLKDVGRFRLASKRFADIGAPLMFTRVSARLSRRELQKLEQLAEWPHLSKHVKKFSYMVPYFYGEGVGTFTDRLAIMQARFGLEYIARFQAKVSEQRQILAQREDLRVLKKAIATFTSLQHVQLLRVHDVEDSQLLTYIRQHDSTRSVLQLEWASACSHGSQTIGEALLASKNVPWCRFSSPMLSPQSAEFLNWHNPPSSSTLAERLTCLTLHFDDGNDLDQKMSELSGLFKTVFTSAKNMQAVHVGFPTHRPLDLPLEDVFHNITWDRLVAFGVQGWKLNAREIVDLALRHKDRLKGLRLRDVLLRDGSMWKDVLSELRDSMHRLEWVSLRRIGYAKQFNQQWLNAGAEVLDELPDESETESDDVSDDDPEIGPSDTSHVQDDTSVDDQDSVDDSDDDLGSDAHEMDFPPLDSPITSAAPPWRNRTDSSQLDIAVDLEDDGYLVSNTKRKMWEKWVMRR